MRRLLFAAILAVGALAVAHESDKDNLPPDQAKPTAQQIKFSQDLPGTVIIRINKKNHKDISVAHLRDRIEKGHVPTGVKFEKIALNTEMTGISYGVVDELDHGSSTSSWRFGVGGGRGGFVARGPNGGVIAGGYRRGFAGGAGGWGGALGGVGGWGGGYGGGYGAPNDFYGEGYGNGAGYESGWPSWNGGWNGGDWNGGGWNGGDWNGGGWNGGGWNGGGWNGGGWNGGGWGNSCGGGGGGCGGGGGWWGGGGGCSGGCGCGGCGGFVSLVPKFIFAGFSYIYRPYWAFADSSYNYGCFGWN